MIFSATLVIALALTSATASPVSFESTFSPSNSTSYRSATGGYIDETWKAGIKRAQSIVDQMSYSEKLVFVRSLLYQFSIEKERTDSSFFSSSTCRQLQYVQGTLSQFLVSTSLPSASVTRLWEFCQDIPLNSQVPSLDLQLGQERTFTKFPRRWARNSTTLVFTPHYRKTDRYSQFFEILLKPDFAALSSDRWGVPYTGAGTGKDMGLSKSSISFRLCSKLFANFGILTTPPISPLIHSFLVTALTSRERRYARRCEGSKNKATPQTLSISSAVNSLFTLFDSLRRAIDGSNEQMNRSD